MKKQFSLLIMLTMFCSTFIYAQDYQARLLKDMVKTEGGKMIMEDFTLITLSNNSTLQLKSHGEAPATSVISRDHFVALFSHIITVIIDDLTKADEGSTSQELESIIGNPDISINVYMAKTGIQIEVKTGTEVDRSTMKWEELFK
jgi:hypothetical protein